MEENNKFQFHMFNMADTSSLPIYVERKTRQGWITYGENNLYPDLMITLMNRSGKHNAILKRKSSMIAGNGWNMEKLDGKAVNFLANVYNEDNMNDIAYKAAFDLEIFGAFALQIIYSKDKSKIAEINFLPVNKIRLSECNEYVYYCEDWSNIRKNIPTKYPIFDPKNPQGSQVLYYKEYRPGNEYYGIPNYISAVNWIQLEYEVSQFHLSQVKNGFSPGMIINFTSGIPSDEEMRDVIKNLKMDFQGARNAGEVMFLFSEGLDQSAQITPVQLNNSDERFIQLNKEITQGILVAHEVTNPGLFGISQEGELGQKNIILESLEIFQSVYVSPKQKQIEKVFNRLLRFNGSQSVLELNEYQIDIEKIEGEDE